jgi:hypothetical protein
MAKFIQLINLDEIKILRITCGKCGAYWSVPIETTGKNPPAKCIYCKTEIPQSEIVQLSQTIKDIQNAKVLTPQSKVEEFKARKKGPQKTNNELWDWKGSVELETEVEKPSK